MSDAANFILVVDDSAPNRLLLRAILEGIGHRVEEVTNGQECLELCSTVLPQMVLLDIMMPEIDGLEVCRQLRKKYAKMVLPIIMVSTLSESEHVAAGLEAGANDYVLKPIDRRVLLARIENHLSLALAQKQLVERQIAVEHALQVQNCIGNALPEAILLHDSAGSVVYQNSEVTKLCGAELIPSAASIFSKIYAGVFIKEFAEKFKYLIEHKNFLL